MLSLSGFWRRHKRKVLVTTGVLGGGYVLYKLYNAHSQRLAGLEAELAREQESSDELLKAKMQAHFESIQSIADTTTLPHVMHYLSSRIAEELDTTDITERLMQMKGKSPEKLELWDRLKVISFTRMVLSLWAMTMLSLYIRVQVNILGRHLYIETARGFGSSLIVEDAELIDRDDQQKFLASSDYLSTYGMPSLILHIQAAAIEVLNGKQLTDRFNTAVLCDTIMQILDKFMSTGSPHHWVNYLMPEDACWAELVTAVSSDSTVLPDVTKFEQLLLETRSVISSGEFGNIAEMALRAVVDTVVVDMGAQSGGDLSSGTPLAKVLARVAQMGPTLLGESSKFRQIILNVPEVELFFTHIFTDANLIG
ncbi:hypothetical protein ACLB2K_052295 [Fragaria x ananassa]